MHLQIQVISFLLQKQFTYTSARIYSKPSTFYPNYKRISFLLSSLIYSHLQIN